MVGGLYKSIARKGGEGGVMVGTFRSSSSMGQEKTGPPKQRRATLKRTKGKNPQVVPRTVLPTPAEEKEEDRGGFKNPSNLGKERKQKKTNRDRGT